MPKCPECGEEVTYLHKYEQTETKHAFRLDLENGGTMEEFLDEYERDEIDFECPYCSECIAHSDKEAEAILLGENNVQSTDGNIKEARCLPGKTEDAEEKSVGS